MFNDLQQIWQQFFNAWSEHLQRAMAVGRHPVRKRCLNAQKQWSEQLEAMAKTFAEIMGTESFASMLGRYMEQSLVWQQNDAANGFGAPDGRHAQGLQHAFAQPDRPDV